MGGGGGGGYRTLCSVIQVSLRLPSSNSSLSTTITIITRDVEDGVLLAERDRKREKERGKE